jgi:hypothetical protein
VPGRYNRLGHTPGDDAFDSCSLTAYRRKVWRTLPGMSWGNSALWAAALGLLLLACGTGAQAWANLTEYRDLWGSAGSAATQAVEDNLSAPVLLWALRGRKGSPGSLRSQMRQMLFGDAAVGPGDPSQGPPSRGLVRFWRDLLKPSTSRDLLKLWMVASFYMMFFWLLPYVWSVRMLWRLLRQMGRALVEIPRNMTTIRHAGGEEAARIATLARMTVIWTVLMCGSVLILAGAAIQLALAYAGP